MKHLLAYAWPGNVRQLQNVLERAVLLRQEGLLTSEDLPTRIRTVAATPVAQEGPFGTPSLPDDGVDLRDAVDRFESALIRQALVRTNWNKNRAATILHLNRTTLVEKLKKRGWLDSAEGAEEEGPASGRRLAVVG
jgi:two-component system response regulator PilR (NtrC family)